MSDYERIRQGYIDHFGDDEGWGDGVFRDTLAMERDMEAHGLDPDDANEGDWGTAYAALGGDDEGGMAAGLGPSEACDEGDVDLADSWLSEDEVSELEGHMSSDDDDVDLADSWLGGGGERD